MHRLLERYSSLNYQLECPAPQVGDDIVRPVRNCGIRCLDGFATVREYAEQMGRINQQFLCVTDHGVMGAVPQQIAQCEKHGLHPIFGCELYVNHMQPEVNTRYESAEFRKNLPENRQKRFDKSSHLTAIAVTEEGYSNLVRITSWGWIHGYYRKPRVNHDVLRRYREGIVFLSGCANSEICNAMRWDGEDAAWGMLERYMDMFTPNFFLEIMMIDYEGQKPYNQFLLKAHDKYGIPLVLTQDCHYCAQEHSHNQRLMLMQQNHRTIQEIQAMIDSGEGEDLFELQDTNLWLKSEEEMNDKWELDYRTNIDYELFKQAKANSVAIAQKAQGLELNRDIKLPKIPNAEHVLWEETLKGFRARHCPATPQYSSRIREEYDLICEKGFASYFMIQKMMTDEARMKGPQILGFGDGSECVGPGRGSACGSLVAYCLRLHDVEPIIHDLRFSRFLSPARGGKQYKLRHTLQPIAHAEVDWKKEGL